jgi:hypothetical protein
MITDDASRSCNCHGFEDLASILERLRIDRRRFSYRRVTLDHRSIDTVNSTSVAELTELVDPIESALIVRAAESCAASRAASTASNPEGSITADPPANRPGPEARDSSRWRQRLFVCLAIGLTPYP